ncbi:MAG: response regulator [Chloroflexi bacterium]|nr:MAG: response regulator [Chloroflexota bacterium]
MKVLVADDHTSVREAVKAILRIEGDIQVVGEAQDGAEALRLAHALAPDAVVLDNWMPGLTGIEVARRIATELPNVSIVLLTLDPHLTELALAAGADAVVMKDAPSGALVRAVRNATGRGRRRALGRRERDRLYADSVFVVSEALEAKVAGVGTPRARLGAAAARLAERLGLNESEVERVELAVLLRDIGKVAVPDAVLTKPGPLAADERAQVTSHAAIGASLLHGSSGLESLAPLVRHHHERWDGSGYPDGLREEAIPLGAQIVGLLDAYNAIVSPRPYKPAFPADFALQQLSLTAGGQFSRRIIATLFELRRDDAGLLLPRGIAPSARGY